MKAPLEPIEFYTSDQVEMDYWDDLRFNTHRWVELSKGYFQCSFCETYHTSATPINIHPVCNKNEYLLNKHIKVTASNKLLKICPNIPTPTYCACDDKCEIKNPK